MAETYELKYFNIRGLVEPVRLLLHDNEIPFKDVQITHEQWPAVKPTMPFGQMPCLYHNGVPLAQSGAIIRHLARKHGLYGSDLPSAAFIDMVYEGIGDLRKKYYDYIYRDSESKESFVTKTAAEELEKLEKLGTRHESFVQFGKKSPFVAGDKISFVDYALFEMMDILMVLEPTILKNYPALKAHHETIAKRPNLVSYLNSAGRKEMKINGNGKQ